jgi:hypothetical protein
LNVEEVIARVQDDLSSGWDANDRYMNPHGVDLATRLLTNPELRTYRNSWDDNKPIELWLVLEEHPGESGYQVVFNDTLCEFGLAGFEEGTSIIYGSWGEFMPKMD